jgi:hypothetical protein
MAWIEARRGVAEAKMPIDGQALYIWSLAIYGRRLAGWRRAAVSCRTFGGRSRAESGVGRRAPWGGRGQARRGVARAGGEDAADLGGTGLAIYGADRVGAVRLRGTGR